ncbi:unnamed protein product [Prunus armeniaca]
METIEHLFKDCPISIATWNSIGVDIGDFGSLDFDDWILLNLKSNRKYANEWYFANKPITGTCNQTLTHLSHSPSPGVCKINSNDSRNNTTGHIGAACVLRYATGAWLKGYSLNLGIGFVLKAKLCGGRGGGERDVGEGGGGDEGGGGGCGSGSDDGDDGGCGGGDGVGRGGCGGCGGDGGRGGGCGGDGGGGSRGDEGGGCGGGGGVIFKNE